MIARRHAPPIILRSLGHGAAVEDDGRELEAFGILPEDVPLIEKPRSRWGIDESGTATHNEGSSDFLVTVAATAMTGRDLEAVSREMGRAGAEFHYSKLSRENPVLCTEIMDGIGRQRVVFVCYPRRKRRSDRSAGNDREYFLESIRLLLEVINEIDRSRKIIVEIDENIYLDEEDCDKLSKNDRMEIKLRKSQESRWIQLADAGASSLGHSLVKPSEKGDFEKIRARSVNVMGIGREDRILGPQPTPRLDPIGPPTKSNSGYNNPSEEKAMRKAPTELESSKNLKGGRMRRRLGRAE